MGRGQELLDAAREGDRRTVEKILGNYSKRSGPFTSLRRGAGPNVQDDNGYTPLHHACLNSRPEIVRLLLQVDASPCIVDKKGATALHLAAFRGDAEVVRMLLAHENPRVNIDQRTADHETALLIAAQFGYLNVVTQLVRAGADITLKNKNDESPLDLAAQYGRLSTVQHLLEIRPQLVEQYKYPMSRAQIFTNTPLHRASKNGRRDVVKALIDAGMDPNVKTQHGTPLHEAARFGKASVVRILLRKGADLNTQDANRKNVYDLLAEYPPEATRKVMKVIREYENQVGYHDSDEDVPPFPVPDSPTGTFGSRRRWDEAEGTSEGDALSVSSAASSCAPLHLHHHGYSKVSGPKHYLKHGRSVDQYVDGKLSYSEYEENHNPRVPVPNPRPSIKQRSQPVAITAMYENIVIKEQNPRRKLRRSFVSENEQRMGDRVRKYSNQERSSLESLLDDQSMNSPSDCERYYDGQRVAVPLSPTHYVQPPTPDHPPPSAKQAENSIHERIRPLSQLIMEVVEEIRIRKMSQGDIKHS